MNKTEG